MIYLASPYAHEDEAVREERHRAAEAHVAFLLQRSRWVFSPIVHCHELKKRHALPEGHEFWLTYDCHILAKADELHVLQLEGWRSSKGIRMELDFWLALRHESQVRLVKADTRLELIYETELALLQMDLK